MENKEFKPYIPAEKIMPENTVTSVIAGVILAVVFGAANAYLGLRVGMTVSASIPAAVVAMGVIRVILRKNSILESNMVQTIGSAGESVAAGAIFTLPTLFLWSAEGRIKTPGILEISLIALVGGVLGVLFMIPLRGALIVREHSVLPYPEGTACAEVLLAGENTGGDAKKVFSGLGFSGLVNFIIDGLKVSASEISITIKGFAGTFGTKIYPAVLSVGYICGARISSYLFAGGILSWLVFIPAIVLFGKNSVLYPATITIGELYMEKGAFGIWENYIKYIGAGTLAAGGIISLIKSFPLIVDTFVGAVKNMKISSETKRTERDINLKFVVLGVVLTGLATWLLPNIPISFFGTLAILVFGFFFATVSSRMVGLVGSSNNPISGMSIATLLFASLILNATGNGGIYGMVSAIAIGSVICIICAVSGDTSQDLKTGFLLGATPKKQQIGEFIGVISSALAIGGTLYLLNKAWGFGTSELAAPQATLMKMITEGVMEGELPWNLVFIGVFLAITVELAGIPVLPFAIGVYLPVQLSACIMVGGVIRFISEKFRRNKKASDGGTLFCSGMIAGEGIAGIILAVFAIFGIDEVIDISGKLGNISLVQPVVGGILFITTIALIFRSSK